MTWLGVFAVVGALAGAALTWHQVYSGKTEAVGCCGCGQCAFGGECVLMKKSAKNSGADLTNPTKNV